MAHVVWRCPTALHCWRTIWIQWTGRWLAVSAQPPLEQCLGGLVPALARAWLQDLYNHDFTTDNVRAATATAWSIVCATIPHRLWLIRNAIAFREEPPVPAVAVANQTWHTAREQIRSIATTDQAHPASERQGQCLARLLHLLDSPMDIVNNSPKQIRLYYDGGSRGNPGPSGSGSVIVEQDNQHTQWRPVWWDSHFLGINQTNNYAEHTGLARGLTECARRYKSGHQHVDVIGDSLLVTRQFRNEAAINYHLFRLPVASTLQAQRHLHSFDFHHTLRTGNKMADWLANLAMDTASTTSAPCTADPVIPPELDQHIANDVSHSLSRLTAPTNVLNRLLLHLAQLLDTQLPTTK